MKLTMGQLVESYPAWERLGSQIIPSLETRHKLMKVAADIAVEKKNFEKLQLQLLKEHGKSIGGGKWTVRPEALESFEQKLEELKNLEISVFGSPVPFKVLENLDISPIDIIALNWLIELPVDETKE